MMKTIFHKILATTALCLAAVGVSSCSAQAAPNQAALEQAEQQIRLQWQKNPKLSYHSLTYKATLQECMESGRFYVQRVLTLQGTWIPVQELPTETLVFRGEREGFKLGKTLGGAGYFFCSPETGELVAYLLMK
ncbi:MAG: hypothetical protein Q4F30_01485 [Akkermansia sp.]|nr:hypothetical protein [Akkermansia sp.]